jgi:hypothetical protein
MFPIAIGIVVWVVMMVAFLLVEIVIMVTMREATQGIIFNNVGGPV